MNRRDLLALIAGTLAEPGALAHAAVDRTSLKELDRAVEHGLTATHTPGLAVAMVRGDGTWIAKGYGYADVDAARRVRADTAFYVASVGKVVTATVLMMLWEEEAFALDDPVAPHLDFPLSHPRYPDVPITFRRLLNHTSGISDQQWYSIDSSTSPSLRDFLISYLTSSGKFYDPDRCFSTTPGKESNLEVVISNAGGTLVGVIKDQQDKPVPAGRVVLLPELSRRSNPFLVRTGAAIERGEFTIETIPPGEYTAIAFPDEDQFTPAFLRDMQTVEKYERFGQRVHIEAREPTRMDLTVATVEPK